MNHVFRIFTILCAFSLFVLLPLTANAHKLRIFAWPEGNIIHGETAFSGNRKAKNLEITVQDAASHTILLTTRTDKQGEFSFKLPDKAVREHLDLLIVSNTGDGHRGEWPLPAAEYLNLPSNQQTEENHTSTPSVASNHIDEQMLRQIVGEELENKLAPLKYMIAENSNNSPDLKDILGGIGYILGLTGILAWVKAKNRNK